MDWNDWLWEDACYMEEYVPRWKAVKRMVEWGLVPQFAYKGYVFACAPRKLTERILTGLHLSRGKHSGDVEWKFGREDGSMRTEEERAHFDHIFNADFWEAFWREWAHWSDVDPTTERGVHRQIDIQEYCWSQVDLAKSAQTSILQEHLYGAEEDDYGRTGMQNRHEDVYLREAAESNQWGGYRR